MSEKIVVISPRPVRRAAAGWKRRWLPRLAVALLLLGLVLATASLVVGRYSRRLADELVAKVLPEIEARTGLHVTIGGIEPGLLGTSVLRNVVVQSNRDGRRESFLRVAAVEVLHTISWRHRTLVLKGVRLDQPSFVVELYPDGRTNLPELLSRLREMPHENAGPPLGDGMLTRLLGGRSAIDVYVEGGSLMIRDLGRYRAADPIVTAFHDIEGELRLDLAARQLDVRAGAEQRLGGGHAFLDAAVSPDRLEVLARLKGVRLDGLARLAPFSLTVSPQSRFSGRLQLIKERTNPRWYLALATTIDKLDIAHRRLASTEVRDFRGGLDGMVIVDPDERVLTTDDLTLRFGAAPLHLVHTVLRDPPGGKFFLDTTLEARRVPVQDLLDGLPEQLIPIIHGARVEGALDFRAHLVVDMEHIEKSLLEADGDVADFRAVSIPLRCDVRRLLDPTYKHLARRQDLLQTTIVLGPQNREFVPFAALGAYLRNAVQICEDGSFFHHHGFLIKHVNDSLRLNLRERRFARGASTITMQLVKNLFLSEEKTLSRKLQEGMLTWWIEREVPKERMFEIYLNIIEFGPHLYGAGPAARHYFQCTPSALSPVQAAWLATIISNPEKHTHPSYGAMVALVVRRMAERGLISDEDLAAMEEEFFQGTEGQHVSLPDDMGGAIDEESDEDDEAEPAFNKNTAPTPAATPAAPAPAAPPAH